VHYLMPLGFAISITAIVTGIVCTARFLVSDHTNKEVYVGLFVGMFCQVVAYFFVDLV
jgi:dolichyl-phosphate-mannose--protein O-mannosyl transferase